MTVPETGKWEGMSSDNFSDTPIPLVKPLPEATELPFADLGPLKDPISAIADLTQAPKALALQGVLAAISVSAQAHANVETLLRPVPLSLFFFSIAESSARKSGVDSLATEAIREHEKPLLEKFDRDEERWNAAEKLRANNRSTFSVIDDGEDTDLDVPLAQPINPRILFDDPTYEGLVRYLEFSQPSIGLISDEGGKVVGGYSMSPQNQVATAAAYSSLWDGRDINKIRAGSSLISLANRRMSLHLSMQPKIAESLFANEQIRDQGILSRVLVVQPDSLKGTRFLVEDEDHFKKVSRAEDALARFNSRLKALLEIKPNVSRHDPQELAPRTLTLEKEARAHLIDFYNVVERLQLDGEVYANISGFAGKAAEQAARIAGNLALFENTNATSVALSQMEVATVLMQFYLGEAVRIFDTGNVSSQVQEAQMLKNWLLTKWTEPLVDLTAINKFGPGALRSTPAVKNLIAMLEEYKWLVRVDERVRIKNRWSNRAYLINGG